MPCYNTHTANENLNTPWYSHFGTFPTYFLVWEKRKIGEKWGKSNGKADVTGQGFINIHLRTHTINAISKIHKQKMHNVRARRDLSNSSAQTLSFYRGGKQGSDMIGLGHLAMYGQTENPRLLAPCTLCCLLLCVCVCAYEKDQRRMLSLLI